MQTLAFTGNVAKRRSSKNQDMSLTRLGQLATNSATFCYRRLRLREGNVAWAYRRALVSAVVIAAATVEILPAVSGAQPLLLERERALKAKDVFKECEACPEMVVIPAGSFAMGAP